MKVGKSDTSQKKSPNHRKVSQTKKFPIYKIPRSKLDRAIAFLEADEETKKIKKRGSSQNYSCFVNLANMVSASRKVDNYMNDTANVLEVARHCAVRGQWPELMKTVAILMENIRSYDVHAALRNALYCIVADPNLNDPSFLEAYLYSNPRCTNAGGITFCIDKILEVFQGVTIIPKRRRNYSESSSDPNSADEELLDRELAADLE